MSIKCCSCGQFIGYKNLKKAKQYFEPSSYFGPEIIEWECKKCVKKYEYAKTYKNRRNGT